MYCVVLIERNLVRPRSGTDGPASMAMDSSYLLLAPELNGLLSALHSNVVLMTASACGDPELGGVPAEVVPMVGQLRAIQIPEGDDWRALAPLTATVYHHDGRFPCQPFLERDVNVSVC